jgi:hypothetical protein
MARVDAVDVQPRVSLKVAELPRFLEYLGVGETRAFHPGQDVVAGAVHDAHDSGHLVSRQAFGEGLDDRDAARDGGFKADHPPRGFGLKCQGMAVMGEESLVGGHHVAARRQGDLGRLLGSALVAAHELHEDIQAGMLRERDGILAPREGVELDAAILGAVAGRHGDHFDRPACPSGDEVGTGLKDSHDACPHGTQAGDADAEGSGHGRGLVRQGS